MRPLSFNSGRNPNSNAVRGAVLAASMRPLSFNSGRVGISTKAMARLLRFNEAAVV